ncbi:MAG: sigma-70 family RNA polymerase sigma factor [Victivallales bacterium]|nr:sigma-70 family RNA polymerase sigma factor [Victivallales bacterium]
MTDPTSQSHDQDAPADSGARTRPHWNGSLGQELKSSYIQKIATFPILSQSEELSLAKQYAEARTALYNHLHKHPALLLAVLQEMLAKQSQIRVGNYFSAGGEMVDGEDDIGVRDQFEETVNRVSKLAGPRGLPATCAVKPDGPFWKAMLPLRPRSPFYHLCLDILQDKEQRGQFVTPEQWEKLSPKLNALQEEMKSAMNTLVERNLRLVISIASHYIGSGIPLSDLVQEGNIGLMRAVERFDYHRGHRFTTYASYWIRQAITRNITNHSRIIRMPANTVKQISQIRAAEQRALNATGELPTVEEIAQETGLSPAKVRALQKMSQQPLSLQSILNEDSTLEDAIPDQSALTPNESADQSSLRETIAHMLETLDEREQKIIRMRFGLDSSEAKTLAEISNEIGLSSERIRQIEIAALQKMRISGAMELSDGYQP